MPGIYIHIPFCIKKCKYCDFISFDNRAKQKHLYLENLVREMTEYKGLCADTVFIGGGTPTSLNAEQLEYLLSNVKKNFSIPYDAEFSIEANPQTLNPEKLSVMKKYGVNRISIGVQSFCDSELLKIGRIHTAETAKNTIRLIRRSGFSNFNIDLMSALPSQTMDSFKKTLQIAADENPAHISCYSLILEENTPLFKEFENSGLILPDEDTERAMYDYACNFLESKGYRQYEISNFAKPGMESAHNIKYWQCMEYVGIGLAAHSYFNGCRFSNTESLSAYLGGEYHLQNHIKLSLKDKIEEFMIMGLRMRCGISRNEFFKRFGIKIENVYNDELNKFLSTGFLSEKNGNIFLSKKGISVSNSIMCEFAVCNLKNND